MISSSGHKIDFSYDGSNRIIEARDDLGSDRQYSYDSEGRLEFASDATSILCRFEYDRSLMTRVKDGSGKEILGITYNSGGRVSEIRLAGGELYRVTYDIDSSNHVTRALVSDPGGKTSEFLFR